MCHVEKCHGSVGLNDKYSEGLRSRIIVKVKGDFEYRPVLLKTALQKQWK